MVAKLQAAGIHAERVPLSGAAGGSFSGDIDFYPRGYAVGCDAPMIAEVKARANGEGFTLIEKWLGDHDALFLIRDRAEPLVVLTWDRFIEIAK